MVKKIKVFVVHIPVLLMLVAGSVSFDVQGMLRGLAAGKALMKKGGLRTPSSAVSGSGTATRPMVSRQVPLTGWRTTTPVSGSRLVSQKELPGKFSQLPSSVRRDVLQQMPRVETEERVVEEAAELPPTVQVEEPLEEELLFQQSLEQALQQKYMDGFERGGKAILMISDPLFRELAGDSNIDYDMAQFIKSPEQIKKLMIQRRGKFGQLTERSEQYRKKTEELAQDIGSLKEERVRVGEELQALKNQYEKDIALAVTQAKLTIETEKERTIEELKATYAEEIKRDLTQQAEQDYATRAKQVEETAQRDLVEQEQQIRAELSAAVEAKETELRTIRSELNNEQGKARYAEKRAQDIENQLVEMQKTVQATQEQADLTVKLQETFAQAEQRIKELEAQKAAGLEEELRVAQIEKQSLAEQHRIELDRLQQEQMKLSQANQALKTSGQELIQEMSDVQTRVEQLNQQNAALEQERVQLSEAVQELGVLRQESDQLKTNLETLTAEKRQVSDELVRIQETSQEDKKEMEQRHAEAEQKIQEVQNTFTELQTRNQELENKALQSDAAAVIARAELQKTQEKLGTIELYNEQLSEVATQREQKLDELQQEGSQLKTVLEGLTAEKQQIVAELERELQVAQTERQAVESKQEDAVKENQALKTSGQELIQEMSDVQTRVEQLNQQNAALEQEREQLSEVATQREQKLDELQQEGSRLKTVLEGLTAEKQQIVAELEQMGQKSQQEKDEFDRASGELQERIEQQRVQAEQLQVARQEAERERDTLEQKNKKLENQVSQADEKTVMAEAELQKVRDQFIGQTASLQRSLDDAISRNNELVTLQQENSRLQGEAKQKIADLERELRVARTERQAVESKQEGAVKENQELKASSQKLVQEMDTLKTGLEQLNQKNIEATTQADLLRQELALTRDQLRQTVAEKQNFESAAQRLTTELEQQKQIQVSVQQENADLGQKIREAEQKAGKELGELQSQLQVVHGELASRHETLIEREKQVTDIKEVLEESLKGIESRDIGKFGKLFRNLVASLGIRPMVDIPSIENLLIPSVGSVEEQEEVSAPEKLPSRRSISGVSVSPIGALRQPILAPVPMQPQVQPVPTTTLEQPEVTESELARPEGVTTSPKSDLREAMLGEGPGVPYSAPSGALPEGMIYRPEPWSPPSEPTLYPDDGYQPEPLFGRALEESPYSAEQFGLPQELPSILPSSIRPTEKRPVEPIVPIRPAELGRDRPMNPLAVAKHLDLGKLPGNAVREGIESLRH